MAKKADAMGMDDPDALHLFEPTCRRWTAPSTGASSICQSTFAKSSVSEYAASPYFHEKCGCGRTEPMSECLCPTENVPAAIGSRPFTENPGMRGSHHRVPP